MAWLPDFDPTEDEPDYNQRVVDEAPASRALIDRKTARYQDEEGGVEPCDVFTVDREFVHVKRMTGSAAMSHVFAQALAAAWLFQSTKEYRDHMRDFMSDKPSLAALMPTARPTTADFTVVLGIISREAVPATGASRHIALSLPLLARTFLAHVAAQLESIGYRFQMAQIPVTAGARSTSASDPIGSRTVSTRVQIVGLDPRRARRVTARAIAADLVAAVVAAAHATPSASSCQSSGQSRE